MSQNECCWSRIMSNIDEIYEESVNKAAKKLSKAV